MFQKIVLTLALGLLPTLTFSAVAETCPPGMTEPTQIEGSTEPCTPAPEAEPATTGDARVTPQKNSLKQRWLREIKGNAKPILLTTGVVGAALILHKAYPFESAAVKSPIVRTARVKRAGWKNKGRTSVAEVRNESLETSTELGPKTIEPAAPEMAEAPTIKSTLPLSLYPKKQSVRLPVGEEKVMLDLADLIVAERDLPRGAVVRYVHGTKLFLLHDPTAIGDDFKMIIGFVENSNTPPLARQGTYFSTHPFDPRLTFVDQPFSQLFPAGLPEREVSDAR